MTKKIQLSQGQFALVDDEDYEWLSQWKWCAMYDSRLNLYYVVRGSRKGEVGYTDAKHRKLVYMHRVIMDTPDDKVVDHENHIGTDNRKTNLRNVSQRQNMQNQKEKGYSKFPGVTWHKRDKKWQAEITINGKLEFLGYFDDEREAAKAYEKALREKCGEELVCKT